MKKLLLLSVVFSLIAMPAARASQAKDDAAIQKRLDEFSAAWNQHDAKLMAGCFAPDGDLINPFGRQAKGTEEIEKLFAGEQSGPMAGTTYSGTIEGIRYLDDDLAVVDMAGEITGMKNQDGSAAPPFKHHVTWIIKEKRGKWVVLSVRAFAYLPAPMPVVKK
jgi:uncharacterized protein (TIGR02246 family)